MSGLLADLPVEVEVSVPVALVAAALALEGFVGLEVLAELVLWWVLELEFLSE